MTANLQLEKQGIVLPGEKRLRGGRNLDGGIWLEFGDGLRHNFTPQNAFKLSTDVLRLLGINVEFEYPGPVGHA